MSEKSYDKWCQMTDKALMETIGKFVQSHRLNQNRSQDQVAISAGISRPTLSLLERGEKVRIDSLLQVLRVLDLLHVMDVFQVKTQVSPVDYAKLQKKLRKKATPQIVEDRNYDDLGW